MSDIPSRQSIADSISGINSANAAAEIRNITAALKTATRMPITVQAGRGAHVAEAAVVQAFKSKGWKIELRSDQRDGDFWSLS